MEENKLYRANPDFIVRKVAGEVLAVPTGATAHELNGAMILSESGALLWERLSKSPQSAADLAAALVEAYEVDAATAAQDAARFLEKAVDEGVVYPV